MRPFEIILIAALCLSLACSALSSAMPGLQAGLLSKLTLLAFLLALLALVLHMSLEGAHWQMIPAYLAVLPTALLAWFALRPKGHLAWPWELVGLLLLAASCVSSYVVPMFRLPAPTGPYAVGTSVLYMVDTSRVEDAGPSPGGKRELMIQLWYPAETGKGKVASYRRKVETTLESSYQAVLPTHSRLDAPVLRGGAENDAPYPVLFFNPGWRGRRTQNTFLTEELASHGYVVAAIDHTYNSMPVAFPDGRVVEAPVTPAVEDLIHTNPAEVEAIGNKEADKEAADVRFVLDELTKLNAEQASPWYRSMDTANAGSLGHSLGGGVSVQAWATDARIHAALNLDGWTFGTQVEKMTRAVPADSVKYPLLFLYEDGYVPAEPSPVIPPANHLWKPTEVEAAVDSWDAEHVRTLIQRYGGYWLTMKGSIHITFIDKPLYSPLARLSGVGPGGAQRPHAIVRDYVVQFFDQALKNKPSALLQGQSGKYPEMTANMHVAAPGPDGTVKH